TLEPPAMPPGPARVAPTDRHKCGLHRYCSGCAHETEHVSAGGGQGSIPSIRRPTTEPADGTTMCVSWASGVQPAPNLALRRGRAGPGGGSANGAWPSLLAPPTPQTRWLPEQQRRT